VLYIALLNILFLKIYVQKLTCCSWKLGFRGIIFSARKLQECRILHHLPKSFWGALRGPQTPCRKATSARWGRVTSARLLNRFEYTSFWGSYAPDSVSTVFRLILDIIFKNHIHNNIVTVACHLSQLRLIPYLHHTSSVLR
jgi:hypothetical protein